MIAAKEWVYPSNLLTIARLLMLPAAIHALWDTSNDNRARALTTLGIAMLTDAIDGPIARHRGEVSELGKLLDPIADKLMLDATALVLSLRCKMPWWVTGLLLFRDAGILLGGTLVYRQRDQITVAHPAGKLTTVALTLALLLFIAGGPRWGKPALYLALIPLLVSMGVYLRSFWRVMRWKDNV